MFHEFAPLIDPILNLIWLCCGIAKTTVTWAKIAHFAMVKKLVVVMDERIVGTRVLVQRQCSPALSLLRSREGAH